MNKKIEWHVGVFLVFIFVSVYAWYLITGGLIEFGGDAFGRWENIRDYVQHQKLSSISHHALRWAVNLPILLAGKLIGFHPVLYHFIMPFYGAGVGVLLFLLLRIKKHSISQDICLLFIVLSIMVMSINERAYSQLLPGGVLSFYICATLLCLKIALTTTKNIQIITLFFAGVFAFFAYGAKLTAVFFLIPVSLYILAIAISRRKYSYLTVFLAPILLGVLLETIWVYQLTGFPFGRALYVISLDNAHGASIYRTISNGGESIFGMETFFAYLLSPSKYYIAYGKYSLIIYSTILYVIVRWLLRLKNKKTVIELGNFNHALLFIIIGFFILQSYVVVNISPYIYPEILTISRYQYPLLMLCILFWANKGMMLLGFVRMFFHQSISILLSFCGLVFSILVLAGPVLTKHNNFGFLVTIIHSNLIEKWFDASGNVGYKTTINENKDLSDIRHGLRKIENYDVLQKYIYAVYGKKYCFYQDAIYYLSSDNKLYGLCNKWQPNETILFHQLRSLEFDSPKDLHLLGKYNQLVD